MKMIEREEMKKMIEEKLNEIDALPVDMGVDDLLEVVDDGEVPDDLLEVDEDDTGMDDLLEVVDDEDELDDLLEVDRKLQGYINGEKLNELLEQIDQLERTLGITEEHSDDEFQHFEVEDENGEVLDATLGWVDTIDGKKYVVYSVESEDGIPGRIDLLASYVVQDEDGYDMLRDIDDPEDCEKIERAIHERVQEDLERLKAELAFAEYVDEVV